VLDKLAFTLVSSSASYNGQETLPSHVFFTQVGDGLLTFLPAESVSDDATRMTISRPASLGPRLATYSWNAVPSIPPNEQVRVANAVYEFCEQVGLVGVGAAHAIIA
jgi:hypothetical protein